MLNKGRLLGVRGLVTALVQGVVESRTVAVLKLASRCTKAVTSPRTPRRRPIDCSVSKLSLP